MVCWLHLRCAGKVGCRAVRVQQLVAVLILPSGVLRVRPWLHLGLRGAFIYPPYLASCAKLPVCRVTPMVSILKDLVNGLGQPSKMGQVPPACRGCRCTDGLPSLRMGGRNARTQHVRRWT